MPKYNKTKKMCGSFKPSLTDVTVGRLSGERHLSEDRKRKSVTEEILKTKKVKRKSEDEKPTLDMLDEEHPADTEQGDQAENKMEIKLEVKEEAADLQVPRT